MPGICNTHEASPMNVGPIRGGVHHGGCWDDTIAEILRLDASHELMFTHSAELAAVLVELLQGQPVAGLEDEPISAAAGPNRTCDAAAGRIPAPRNALEAHRSRPVWR